MKNLQDPLALRIASIMGFLCILIGAFGAHALKLEQPHLDWFEKANRYHMFTTGLMLFLALYKQRSIMYLNLFGFIVFSGGLYAMALGAPRFLGAIVPLGGLAMMLSYILLFIKAWQAKAGNELKE